MKMKKKHRLLALVLAVSMCIPMMTVSAYADEVVATEETVLETSETFTEEVVVNEEPETVTSEETDTQESETAITEETAIDETIIDGTDIETSAGDNENAGEQTEAVVPDTEVMNESEPVVPETEESVLLDGDGSDEIPDGLSMSLTSEYSYFYNDGSFTFNLNKWGFDGLDYKIQYTVSEWNKKTGTSGAIYPADTYEGNNNRIILDGKKLSAAGAHYLHIEAKAVCNDRVICHGWAEIELKEPVETYYLQYSSLMMNGSQTVEVNYNIEDAAHPYGHLGSCDIKNVTVSSQSSKGVLSVKYIENRDEYGKLIDSYWRMNSGKSGLAKLKVTFTDVHKKNRTQVFPVYVKAMECDISAWSVDHVDHVLPGQSVALASNCTVTNERGTYKLTYQWDIAYDTEKCAKIVPDSNDPSKATLSILKMPEGTSSYFICPTVHVGQMINGEFVENASYGVAIYVEESFDELKVDGVNPYLGLGKTQTVTAELRRYSSEYENGYKVVPDVTYTYSIGKTCAKVQKGSSAGIFSLTRTGLPGGSLKIKAAWTEDGEKYEMSKTVPIAPLTYEVILSYPAKNQIPYNGDLKMNCVIKGSGNPHLLSPGMVVEIYSAEDSGKQSVLLTKGTDYDIQNKVVTFHGAKMRSKLHKAADYDGFPNLKLRLTYYGTKIFDKDIYNDFQSKTITSDMITIPDVSYTGKQVTPKITIKDGSIVLKENIDYIFWTSKYINPGTYTVRIFGQSALYNGDITKSFNVKYAPPVISNLFNTAGGVKLTWGKVKGAAKYRVFRKTGSGSWTKMTDTTNTFFTDKTAKNGTQYTYTVRCISADGKHFTSNYDKTGKTIVYLLRPSISSLTSPKTAQMTVKWGKNAKATGYIIQYSVSSKFTGAKNINVKGAAAVSKTITNLTAKKKYYVRVRTYKTVSSKNYYSTWSAAKNVTTK